MSRPIRGTTSSFLPTHAEDAVSYRHPFVLAPFTTETRGYPIRTIVFWYRLGYQEQKKIHLLHIIYTTLSVLDYAFMPKIALTTLPFTVQYVKRIANATDVKRTPTRAIHLSSSYGRDMYVSYLFWSRLRYQVIKTKLLPRYPCPTTLLREK